MTSVITAVSGAKRLDEKTDGADARACSRASASQRVRRPGGSVRQTVRLFANDRPGSALVRRGRAARRTGVQMPLDVSLLARRELVVDVELRRSAVRRQSSFIIV